MPLEDSYLDQLKSSVADLANSGGRLGGSITAALFLKEFVDLDKVGRGWMWMWLGGGGCGGGKRCRALVLWEFVDLHHTPAVCG
jgi:hypothetical protein